MELAAEAIMDSVYRFANVLALPGVMELRSSPYFRLSLYNGVN